MVVAKLALVLVIGAFANIRKVFQAETFAVHHLPGVLGREMQLRALIPLVGLDALERNVAFVPLVAVRGGLGLGFGALALLLLVGLGLRDQAVHLLLFHGLVLRPLLRRLLGARDCSPQLRGGSWLLVRETPSARTSLAQSQRRVAL